MVLKGAGFSGSRKREGFRGIPKMNSFATTGCEFGKSCFIHTSPAPPNNHTQSCVLYNYRGLWVL